MHNKEEIIDEKEQLDQRLNHLTEQINAQKFMKLPLEAAGRLTLQAELMKKYSEVLGERIRTFEDSGEKGGA